MRPSIELLKRILWDRWGSSEFPAEWDGRQYGGGRGSQRFWEYMWVIDQLDGAERRILDVGAGPKLFLSRILDQAFEFAEAIDPALAFEDERHHRSDLRSWVANNQTAVARFDCVTCVSVAEHLRNPVELFRDLARFEAAKIIITLELGFDPPGFDYQFTMREIYSCLECFEAHYLSLMQACPVWADNSKGGYWRPLGMVLLPKARMVEKAV